MRPDPFRNTRHYLAWLKFRASLEPAALAESIAQSEFLAWREVVRETELLDYFVVNFH